MTDRVIIIFGEAALFCFGVFARITAALMLLCICVLVVDRTPVCAKQLRLQGVGNYAVAPCMEILKDTGGLLSIDQLVDASFVGAFSSVDDDSINLGVTDAVYWLRFSVVAEPDSQSATAQPLLWLFNLRWPLVQQLDVFAVSVEPGERTNIETVATAGSKCRFFDPVPQEGCRTVFYLPPVTGIPKTLYIRIVPIGNLILSPVITTMKGYQDGKARGMLRCGLMLGMFFALCLYSFVMFIAVHEHSYAWLSLFIFFLGACYALTQPLVVDNLLGLPLAIIHRYARLSFGLSMGFIGCFVRSFVITTAGSTGARQVDRLLWVYILQSGFLSLLACFGKGPVYELAFAFAALLAMPFLVVAMLTAWRTGAQGARFLFIASVVVTGFGVLQVMMFAGIVPFSPVMSYLFEISCLCGFGLLVCALGDSVQALHQERETLRVSERRHRRLAFTDALTGLFNWRYFRIQLDLETRRTEQLQQSFTLMMMDIDNFKLFNDGYGHLEGDRVLHHLGGLIGSIIRERDVACRYGGEEFAVLLPGSDHEAAILIHARLQVALQQWAQQKTTGLPHAVTLSVGVAEYRPGDAAEDIIARADSAMYAAKQGGRDQLVVSRIGNHAEDVKYRDCYSAI